MQPDFLVLDGGELKALDDAGRIGGHLVLFGSPEATDASSLRDFFTPETDFGLDLSARSYVLYNHGLDPKLGNRSLGVADLKMDEVGIWMEAQLKLRDEYERKVLELVRAGKMGLSSGTAAHLTRREKQPNGSHKIVSWPLGLDASITPTPAEPRTAAVSLKSLLVDGEGPHVGQTLTDHLGSVHAAVKGLCDRLDSYVALKRDEGRTVPAERRAQLAALRADLDRLIVAAEPRATVDEAARLYAQFQALSDRYRDL